MLTEEMARRFIETVESAESEQMRIVREKVDEVGRTHEEIFPSQMAFFRSLCLASGVQEILELGTFLGYSTTGFAELLKGSNGHVTTIELDPERAAMARQLIASGDLDKYVTFVVGEDRVICQDLLNKGRKFDLIFLDTFEQNYLDLYPLCVDLLKPRGILIVDNVLMLTVDGWKSGRNVIESDNDLILTSLQDLLRLATADRQVATSIVPLGSGLLVCVKRPSKDF